MTLRLTPEMLEAAYELIRQSQPFKGWKLPASDDVEFHVIRDPSIYADFVMDGDTPVIRVSEKKHGHLNTLLMTMAHECIHFYQERKGLDTKSQHNADFRQKAAKICAIHGWDKRTF